MRLARSLSPPLPSPPPPWRRTDPEGLVQHYTCAGGAHLAAAYINPPEGGSYAVVVFDGKMTPMKAGLTGSGVRYVSLSEPAASSGTPRATTASSPTTTPTRR